MFLRSGQRLQDGSRRMGWLAFGVFCVGAWHASELGPICAAVPSRPVASVALSGSLTGSYWVGGSEVVGGGRGVDASEKTVSIFMSYRGPRSCACARKLYRMLFKHQVIFSPKPL